MGAIELKKHLNDIISEINNEDQLIAISRIMDSKAELIENYNLDLNKSEKDIHEGNTTTHKEVLEKIAQWKKR